MGGDKVGISAFFEGTHWKRLHTSGSSPGVPCS